MVVIETHWVGAQSKTYFTAVARELLAQQLKVSQEIVVTTSSSRLALDIVNQPAAVARTLAYHSGPGRLALQEAARLIRAAPRIVIVGMGASLNASIAALENALCTHGKDALAVEAGELLHYRRGLYQDATFVVVSRSGESVEIERWLAANAGRMPVIGVTNVPHSTLARAATVTLDLHSPPDGSVAIQSYVATLVSLNLLAMAAFNRLDNALREVEALLPAFAHLVASQGQENWDSFLIPPGPLYVLGRGPSLGSALQGALLFGEVAKVPAVGMAVASFRHGPIEVVDAQFKALVLAPIGATQALNIGLAADIARFGGSVRIIGPPATDQAGIAWIPTPTCSDTLAPLFEVVPLQTASLRLAELCGVALDKFRYTPQVARDEATMKL